MAAGRAALRGRHHGGGGPRGYVDLYRFDLFLLEPPNDYAVFAASFTDGPNQRCTEEASFGACRVLSCTDVDDYEEPASADAGTISVEEAVKQMAASYQ